MMRRGFAYPRALALVALMALLSGLLMATSMAARTGGGSAGTVAGVDARTLFDRVHVIGASASSGFGVRAPLPVGHPGRREMMSLSRIAQAARMQPGAVSSDASSLFFTSPLTVGHAQVDAVLKDSPKPTVVLAVDYLFWFTYGALDAERTPIRKESQRLELLKVGLAELDRVVRAGIPVVVGDLPDMSEAVGGMLSQSQMPKGDTLTTANEQIRAWAAERPLVAVVPLATLLRQLKSDEPFQAGSRKWSTKSDGPLIQADRLHPTFAGSVALLARAEQAAGDHFRGSDAPGLATQAFDHDPARVGAAVKTQIEAEVAKRTPVRATQ